MATMTSVPVVDVEKYEQHLAGKTAQVQALFKDFPALPELEVSPFQQLYALTCLYQFLLLRLRSMSA